MRKVEKPVGIKLEDGQVYVPVKNRLIALRNSEYRYSLRTNTEYLPSVRAFHSVATLEILETGEVYTGEALVYLDTKNPYEKVKPVESCSTSAIGRALGTAGIGITDNFASVEEAQTMTASALAKAVSEEIKQISGTPIVKKTPFVEQFPSESMGEIAMGYPEDYISAPVVQPEKSEELINLEEKSPGGIPTKEERRKEVEEMGVSGKAIKRSPKNEAEILQNGYSETIVENWKIGMQHGVNFFDLPGRNTEKKFQVAAIVIQKGTKEWNIHALKNYGENYVIKTDESPAESPAPAPAPAPVKETSSPLLYDGKTIQEQIALQNKDYATAAEIRAKHPATAEEAAIEKKLAESPVFDEPEEPVNDEPEFAPASKQTTSSGGIAPNSNFDAPKQAAAAPTTPAEKPSGHASDSIVANMKATGNMYGLDIPVDTQRADPAEFSRFYLELYNKNLDFDVLAKKYEDKGFSRNKEFSDFEDFLRRASVGEINEFLNAR